MFLNVLTIVMLVLRRSSRRDTVDLEAADPAAAAGRGLLPGCGVK